MAIYTALQSHLRWVVIFHMTSLVGMYNVPRGVLPKWHLLLQSYDPVAITLGCQLASFYHLHLLFYLLRYHFKCPFSPVRKVFGRPFVKLFALCHQTVVCLSGPVCPVCLSVTLVYCGQTVGWIRMKLGMQVGLGRGHMVLDRDPAPPPKKGVEPHFSAHVCCDQMAAWIKMPCHLVWR